MNKQRGIGLHHHDIDALIGLTGAALGDLITFDADGTPVLLHPESDDDVLTLVDGSPAWVAGGGAGSPGPVGARGPAGMDGNDGEDGIPGPAGRAGVDGSTGATGATGPQGTSGVPGSDGVDGEDSLVPGPQGPVGATGPTGSAGATGAVGPQGVPGNDGEDGADSNIPGPAGPVGATGASGSQGIPGTTGAQGVPGWDGDDGSDSIVPGPQGPVGATGATGSPGSNGTDGARGAPGLDGTDGEDGIAIPGPVGPVGATGPQGVTGAQGPLGPVYLGQDGEDGDASMIPGPRGLTGAAGPAGPVFYPNDGEDGSDGWTIVGPVGPQGATGAAGPPGPVMFPADGEDGEAIMIPGPRGATGPAGPMGLTIPVPEYDEGDPLMSFPPASNTIIGTLNLPALGLAGGVRIGELIFYRSAAGNITLEGGNAILNVSGLIVSVSDLFAQQNALVGKYFRVGGTSPPTYTTIGDANALRIAARPVDLTLWDGWRDPAETPTRFDDTHIDVTNGALYQKGDKIKFTQNAVVKYFYVIGIATNRLAVVGQTATTVVTSGQAISAFFWSREANPLNFPTFTWTPGFTGFTAAPTTTSATFEIRGSICNVRWSYAALGTSSGTGFGITGLPVASAVTVPLIPYLVFGADNGANIRDSVSNSPLPLRVDIAGTVLALGIDANNPNTWTGGGVVKGAYGFDISYPI